MMPLQLVIDGVAVNAADVYEDLPRAVLVSLFTWRRANADDALPAAEKYGWWGDSYPVSDNDRIGSRLWLLQRAKFTTETANRAKEYADEALQWLVDDGVAGSVKVVAERQSLDRLALGVLIVRGDGGTLNIRFASVWDYLHPGQPVVTPPPVVPGEIAGVFLVDSLGSLLVDMSGDALRHIIDDTAGIYLADSLGIILLDVGYDPITYIQ